ncbi:hypothetical protein Tco_0887051 [Tanacetum coccineum]
MMMYSATNSLYPCVYLATHQPPIQFVSSSAQQSPIHYYGAPAMSPAPVSYAPTPPHAFHTMTLQNPNWNMDTGASSHLADNTSILTSCSNSSIYPSVFVGNGHSIPVTHTGHNRRLSISKEALGAFGKSQTYSAEDRYRGRGQEAEQKQVKIMKDKRDKNTVEDRIMDYGASFHATYCKEKLERFKLRSGKVDIYFCKPGGLGKQKNLSFIMSVKTRKLQRSCGRYNANLQVKYLKFDNGGEYSSWSIKFCVENGIVMLKMVPKTPLQFDSVSTTYLIYRIPYVSIRVRIREDEWRGKDTSLTHLKVFGCDSFVKVKDVCEEAMKCTFIGNGSDEIQYSFRNTKSHHVIRSRDITFMDSIHEASPGGSSDTSEGSEDSGSFEDSEDQMNNTLKTEHPPRREALTLHRYKDPPESPGLRDGSTIHIPESDYLQEKKHHKACRCSGLKKNRIVAKGTRLDWWLRFPTETREPSYMGALNDTPTQHKSKGFQLAGQEENLECRMKEILYELIQALRLRCSEKHGLGYVLTVGVTTVEWESRLHKSITMLTIEV